VEEKSATRAQPSLNGAQPSAPSTKSERKPIVLRRWDAERPQRWSGWRRALATVEAAPRFASALDIPKGGVLLALPALLVSGLLRHTAKYFRLPAGFYGLTSIFLLLAFTALGRLRSIEALRYYAPGEWGKLLGLDRAPEVRTLRIKLKHLADQDRRFPWSSTLCKEWMLEAPEEAAVPYVDGHVRVYQARRRSCPSTTSHANAYVSVPPPTIGSTPWTASPSS
jgi:hypothetical protein